MSKAIELMSRRTHLRPKRKLKTKLAIHFNKGQIEQARDHLAEEKESLFIIDLMDDGGYMGDYSFEEMEINEDGEVINSGGEMTCTMDPIYAKRRTGDSGPLAKYFWSYNGLVLRMDQVCLKEELVNLFNQYLRFGQGQFAFTFDYYTGWNAVRFKYYAGTDALPRLATGVTWGKTLTG